ncbi:hypothetical protein GF336_02460, partial [Candidatus Woesearchaeota archaeon]|nr:hypothetical protein [Candidatus Woesearchaeota archaeon]
MKRLILLFMILIVAASAYANENPNITLEVNQTIATTTDYFTVTIDAADDTGLEKTGYRVFDHETDYHYHQCSDDLSCIYTWTVLVNTIGNYTVQGAAKDVNGRVTFDSIDITIRSKPNITSITAEDVDEADVLDVSFSAEDNDDNIDSYQISRNGTVVADSSSYSWDTDYDDAGEYEFSFYVVDEDGYSDIETRTVNINNVNRLPNITEVNVPASLDEGELLNVNFSASDADDDISSYLIYIDGIVVASGNSFSWNTN